MKSSVIQIQAHSVLQKIVESSNVDTQMFNLFLHENYLPYFVDIDEVVSASRYLSDADTLTGSWQVSISTVTLPCSFLSFDKASSSISTIFFSIGNTRLDVLTPASRGTATQANTPASGITSNQKAQGNSRRIV